MTEVRLASAADAAGVANVLNRIIDAGCYTALDTKVTAEQEREFISGFPSRGVFHVATNSEGHIIGFQNVEPFASYTHAFDHVGVIGTYVDLAHHRVGVATRLFAATIGAVKAKGYEKLFAYVRADNPAALAVYRSHGFAAIGVARAHAKIAGRYIDEILIERLLE